jgi:hypothetical protein
MKRTMKVYIQICAFLLLMALLAGAGSITGDAQALPQPTHTYTPTGMSTQIPTETFEPTFTSTYTPPFDTSMPTPTATNTIPPTENPVPTATDTPALTPTATNTMPPTEKPDTTAHEYRVSHVPDLHPIACHPNIHAYPNRARDQSLLSDGPAK